MIPARQVKSLHDMLVRDYTAYVAACSSDQRRTQNKLRTERTGKTYWRTVVLVATRFGIEAKVERDGWVSNKREIEQALDALFPGWVKTARAAIPHRMPSRYTKRSQVWRRPAPRKPAAPPVRPSKPSEEEK